MGSRNAPKRAKPRPPPTASVVPTKEQQKALEEETEDYTILIRSERHISFDEYLQDRMQADVRPHYNGERLSEGPAFKVIRNIKNLPILALIWKETMASEQAKAAAGIDAVSLKGHVCINQIATMLCGEEKQRQWTAAGKEGKAPPPTKRELQSFVMRVRRVVEAARDYGLITKGEKHKTAIPLQGTDRLRQLMKVFLFSEAGDRGPGGC